MDSNIAKKVENLLKNLFPSYRLQKEKYVNYAGNVLRFDFYFPELKLLVEVQGEQHYSFNTFYHSSKIDFLKQKYRDNLKKTWATENNLRLLCLKYDIISDLNETMLKNIIIDLIKS